MGWGLGWGGSSIGYKYVEGSFTPSLHVSRDNLLKNSDEFAHLYTNYQICNNVLIRKQQYATLEERDDIGCVFLRQPRVAVNEIHIRKWKIILV